MSEDDNMKFETLGMWEAIWHGEELDRYCYLCSIQMIKL